MTLTITAGDVLIAVTVVGSALAHTLYWGRWAGRVEQALKDHGRRLGDLEARAQ